MRRKPSSDRASTLRTACRPAAQRSENAAMPHAAKRRQARNFRHLPLPRFAFALLAANGVLASANRTTSWNGRFPCLGQSPRAQRIPPKISLPRMGIAAGSPSAERIGCGVLAATHPLSCGSGAYMRWKAAIPPTRQPFCSEIPKTAKIKKTARRKPVRRFFDAFSIVKATGARTLSRAAQLHRESSRPPTQAALRSRAGEPHAPQHLRQG